MRVAGPCRDPVEVGDERPTQLQQAEQDEGHAEGHEGDGQHLERAQDQQETEPQDRGAACRGRPRGPRAERELATTGGQRGRRLPRLRRGDQDGQQRDRPDHGGGAPQRVVELVPDGQHQRARQAVAGAGAEERAGDDVADDEQGDHDERPLPDASERGVPGAAAYPPAGGEQEHAEQRQEPGQQGDRLCRLDQVGGELLAPERGQRDLEVVGDPGPGVGRDLAQRGDQHGGDVGDAQHHLVLVGGDQRAVEGFEHRADHRPEGVAGDDRARRRLDQRPHRGQLGLHLEDLVGQRDAEVASDRGVGAYGVGMRGEGAAVDDLTVDDAGEDADEQAEHAEDRQDPREPASAGAQDGPLDRVLERRRVLVRGHVRSLVRRGVGRAGPTGTPDQRRRTCAGRWVRGAIRGPRRGRCSPATTTSSGTRPRCGRQGSR